MNRTPILFLNVLVVATCRLVYELLAGTLASYVLGDAVTRFSRVIGVYLSALGAAVGLWGTWLLRPLLPRSPVGLRLRAVAVLVLLGAGLAFAEALTTIAEEEIYSGNVIYTKSTPYQRIVVVQHRYGFQLFLNG